jgi:hypothetical protein
MIYINHEHSIVFVINHKCAFSTFESLVRDHKLYRVYFDEGICYNDDGFRQSFDKNKVVLYATLRSPFKRILSFYNDKFINCFNDPALNADNQICQQAMYQYYDEAKIRNLNFSFADLITAIKQGYHDIHLIPQYSLLNHFGLEDLTILNMDKADFNDKCSALLGFNLPIRNNSIKRHSEAPYAYLDDISENDKVFIKQKYRDDFALYDLH